MLEDHKIYLSDRIKETSYTLGTQNFVLNGAVNGFSSFGSVYSSGDNVFYAATDGAFYEVGSGIYISGVQNSLVRFPFRSSNNNQKVNFGEGLKEIFVTYPATHSVYSASGLQNQTSPVEKRLAFWSSSNIINHDANLTWDSGYSRLGIKKEFPSYSIDVGGEDSLIRSSGVIVGGSGVIFPYANNGDSSYEGGAQLVHFEPNELENSTSINSVIELSGSISNHILLKKQTAGFVFAGPVSGCAPPCSPDYPNFRPLFLIDIGELEGLSKENDGFRFDSPVAINTTPSDSCDFSVESSGKTAGCFTSTIISSTSELNFENVALSSSALHKVEKSAISSGYMTALNLSALRNTVSGDVGTLSGIFGAYIRYGNQNSYAQNPITTNAYGIYIAPHNGSGTISNSYDIYIEDSGINTGSITNHYGIYQKGNKKNVLNGKLSVNSDAVHGTVNSFNNSFDPVTSGHWLKSSYVASGLYGGSVALLDTVSEDPIERYGYSMLLTNGGLNLNFRLGSTVSPISNLVSIRVEDQEAVPESTFIFYGNKLRVLNDKTPASSSSSGNVGEICWDNNYMYVCVSDNTWKRTYLSTW